MLVLILSGSLAAPGGMMGCGDGTPGMTPGTYAYTITATEAKANLSLNTTANVTVRQVKPESLILAAAR